eukprot:CAMPEP_0181326456 /NCGR_PEP_ID=MMETSP1101-20121128/21506_1 /TAXON_ID=46948 /ORGANISM="Rhodomonas abbreviata, Strain Caron Lab Isolate" /LENGTH=346 /DNA_ID=CAMNT_0023434907 /DNA_START=22 /DNA_END=1060 /DNA_ORIENTATION=-
MSESIFNLIDMHNSRSDPSLLPKHVATHAPEAAVAPSAARRVPSGRNLATQPTKSATSSAGPARGGGSFTKKAEVMKPSMAMYDLAKSAATQSEDLHPKTRSKPAIPTAARPKPELDSAEVARRRQQAQMAGSVMAAALAPEAKRRSNSSNHLLGNKEKLKEQSIINGLMKAQGEVPLTRPAARKPEFTGKPKQAPEPGEPDFLEDNKRAVLENAGKRVPVPAKQKYQQTQRPAGQIPKYLVERKIEMEVAQAMAEDEEKRRTGGPAVMPEEERVATLKELEAQKAAALKEMNSIPPSKIQLAAYQSQIKKLETRMAEIEKAILLFSRKIVTSNDPSSAPALLLRA